jgi:hypothetical protein
MSIKNLKKKLLNSRELKKIYKWYTISSSAIILKNDYNSTISFESMK